MKPKRVNIRFHLICITCIFLLLVLCILYPFLPGEYDPLAMPISYMVQVFGIFGLPLAIIGILWLLIPKHQFVFGIIALCMATTILLLLALIATLSVGKTLGVVVLFLLIYLIYKSIPALKNLKTKPVNTIHPAPLYLVTLPLLILACQFILLKPVTRWSKDRAIKNANQFISEIETYRKLYGQYPLSLHAQHKDYLTNVVGVEKYFYSPHGNGYNLSFEQPRFLVDDLGVREWLVYNPTGEHRFYSHTAWLLLPPATVEAAQGWYVSGETGYPHWKYFLLD